MDDNKPASIQPDLSGLPTFGEPVPGQAYTYRPGGYAIVFDPAGRLAAIQTRIGCFLPGGGCEAGETPEQAVLREAVEESGRRLEIIRPLGQALDYFQASGSGRFYQVHSTFYLARLDDAPIHAPVDGHTLVWLEPEEAAKRLLRPSQAWALGLAAEGGKAANHTPPYPILEYDSNPEAMIEPARVIRPRDVPEHCVLCFFQEVISQVVEEHQAQVAVANRWEDGPHPLYEIRYNGQRLAFCHPGIGSALAGSLLEELIGFGCRKFIACGGCGVLEKEMQVGQLVVVTAAVRDEGLSYHYLAPGRQVAAHPAGIAALSKTLEQDGIPYRLGKTWTTDAPYRETAGRTARRRQEGCITVEMEAAGLMAVAQFRKVILGQVLYGGDDLSGEQWDSRGWQSRSEVRRSLFWLAAEACLAIEGE